MQYLIIRDLTKADCKEEYRMKHIVVDLEMNNIRQKSEARKICTMGTIEIGNTIGSLIDFSAFACA